MLDSQPTTSHNDPPAADPPAADPPAADPPALMGDVPAPDFGAIGRRLLLVLALGGLTGAALAAELRPLLLLIAGSGGGWLASRLFAWLREQWGLRVWVRENWTQGAWTTRRVAHAVGWMIYSPATAALTVAVFGLLFSGAATAGLAYLQGASFADSWAAFVAFVASQLVYLMGQAEKDRIPKP